MGRPKVKIIDDSQPLGESQENFTDFVGARVKRTSPTSSEQEKKPVKKGGDALVESLKAELGIQEEKLEDQASSTKPQKPASRVKHPVSKITRSKQYQAKVKELSGESTEGEEPVDFRTKSYKVDEAIELVKKSSFTKYTGTLEAHINTASTGIRGTISLPFASGKELRVAVFGPSAGSGQAKELEEMGVIIGDDNLLENIKKGKMDFDILITTAEWMPKLAPLARVLGPKSLMPNPKNGTITTDLKKAVEGYQAGKTEYKTESKAPVMHLSMGKLDQPTEELAANIKTLLQTLGKSRVKKVTLAPTMGPSVRLDLSSI